MAGLWESQGMLFIARRRGNAKETEGGPREDKMLRSFQKSLSMFPLEKMCFCDQRRRIMLMANIYCMLTICVFNAHMTGCLMLVTRERQMDTAV